MDKKSKILFAFLSVFIIFSVGATFYKTIILQDFVVYSEIDCDPASESCFIRKCDPEVDGTEICSGNPEDNTWYYKMVYKNAKNVAKCGVDAEDCNPFQCMEGEDDCREVLCTADTLAEYKLDGECTNPVNFQEVEEIEIPEEESAGVEGESGYTTSSEKIPEDIENAQ